MVPMPEKTESFDSVYEHLLTYFVKLEELTFKTFRSKFLKCLSLRSDVLVDFLNETKL